MRKKLKVHSKHGKQNRVAAQSETQQTQLRRLIAHLQAAREDECVRIIHAVHDELLPRLVRASLDLGELRRQSVARARTSRSTWNGAAQYLKEAIQIAAGVRTQLRPPLLDHCGLDAAIGWTTSEWTKRHGLGCDIVGTTNSSQMTPTMVLELFRLFEEGLRSLTDNCDPVRLTIVISSGPTAHCLTLHTRAPAANARHKLLRSPTFLAARERALRLGGKLIVRAKRPFGISLAIIVPA